MLFASLLPRLLDEAIRYARQHGLELAIGEIWRSHEEALRLDNLGLGSMNSLHCDRLAVDLILREHDGAMLSETKDYEPLGVFWESLGPRCRWGGRWTHRQDGDHFSLATGGRE